MSADDGWAVPERCADQDAACTHPGGTAPDGRVPTCHPLADRIRDWAAEGSDAPTR